MSVRTNYMNSAVGEMSDMHDVIKYCNENRDALVDVAKELNALITGRGITVNQFISRCKFSRNNKENIEGWFKGTSEPRGRAQYIKIVIGMGMNLDEANRFLAYVGGFGRLYPKNIEDAACIHIINNGGTYTDYAALVRRMEYELYDCMFRETRRVLPPPYVQARESIHATWDEAYYAKIDALNKKYQDALKKSTRYLRDSLKQDRYLPLKTRLVMDRLADTDDMIEYVRGNWREIVTANFNLYRHIDGIIKQHAYVNPEQKKVDNMHALMFDSAVEEMIPPETSGKMNKYYSELGCYGKPMPRNYIILLGLLYDLDAEGINVMLEIAHMDLLCARREGEAALISAISNSRQINRLSDVKEYIGVDDVMQSEKMKEIVALLFSEEDFEALNIVRPAVKVRPVRKKRQS